MFPWKSILKFSRESTKPIYLQLADAIIKSIHEGHLFPGQKLPGARVLGDLLNLNRKTVTAALEELSSQGWVESYEWKGTFVSNKLPELKYKPLHNTGFGEAVGETGHKVNKFRFLESLYLDYTNVRLIDDGVSDVRLSPLDTLYAYHRSILSKNAFSALLKYNHIEGDLDLRMTLKSYLHTTRGIVTDHQNIFITRGSQMAIYITVTALLKKGDYCITSLPGYQIVDNIINHSGGKVAHVAVDNEGIDVGEVDEICKKKKVRLLYITPHHHYPTTVRLSPKRRIELLQLAIKHNFYILEDDYDYDLHYDNSPLLPLASLNKDGRVIYIGSFSKCLSPSVRVGYFVAPKEIMEAANKLRRIIDRQGDPLLERAVSEFIKSGDLDRHLKKTVRIYKHRRDYFCALLQSNLSEYLSFMQPEGGMSVWLVFKNAEMLKNLPDKLLKQGYLLETDNIFTERFNGVRIGFASLNDVEMDKFIETVKHILD
ncbi:PLP-dependent aminotransferase family protein [Sinomicrobium kalidii]|uniref:MocR-like pyridoxine biosynthesis transcription factor PdxR n=1 Tax=Sinomicrobium kalidii TaxID=2900738 RepID=UPI001E4E9220|nr:PLP-dependent aminotransferase family protein [Sinomicrobium kalidii]UGU17689.1 PLP-dependent aminotransferase family protein [Sinomicrobium kalidii]